MKKSTFLEAPMDAGPTPASPDAPPIADSSTHTATWLVWLRAKLATERAAVLAVVVLGCLLFLPFLGTLGLWDPWETHYGEVAREMIVRDDYVYPYWESAYFFSKPALGLWLIALGLLAVGAENTPTGAALGDLHAWGARLPFAIIAIATLWAVYRVARQIKDRATGFVAVIVLGSCAQFIFIGKQAMTDMPFVGLMTIGLALFVAAVFDDETASRASHLAKLGTSIAFILALHTQLFVIGREMKSGSDTALVAVVAVVGVALLLGLWIAGTKRDCYLLGFYTALGLASLAKSPLAVLAVVGPTVLLYMIFAWDFALLRRCRLALGSLAFLLVAAPWYVTLSLFGGRDDEGKTFVDRFWFHDNFARVGAGVHGDRGGFGYFIEQIGYGMFPWVATLPFAIGFAARYPDEEARVEKRRAMLFVLIWALFTFCFFSMSQTKFHHYIFPAVPPLAILVAVWFAWVAENPNARLRGFMPLVIAAIFAVAARDLINDPQHLVNLFTYKYDREFPRELNPRIFIALLVAAASIAFVVFYVLGKNANVLLAFLTMAILFGAWISHHHFNMLSPHWSQAHLFETFYKERRGDEPIYAYQLNWRGETFYSRNQILQVKEAGANERMRTLVDRPGREFIVTEQSRFQTLKGLLSKDMRDKLRILDRSSNKFYLCVVDE